jgi:Zn-dependent peptidase ImmA (M78 family)
VPEEVMRSDEDFRTFVYSGDSPHELLEKLSSRFKVSTRVILVRMLTSGLISRKRYQEEIAYLESQEEERGRQEEKPRRFAISQARKCFQERGRLFTSLVLEGKERELVTYSDVTDYLSLRLRHLDKLQPLIWV